MFALVPSDTACLVTAVLSILLYRCTILTLTRHRENAWSQLHKNAASIPRSSKIRRTRYAGHRWRSRDDLISDVLLWTSSHWRAKTGRPARTYIQQRCADTGCSPEDLPETMGDREGWQERLIARHDDDTIYQPLRLGRIWHKVNF